MLVKILCGVFTGRIGVATEGSGGQWQVDFDSGLRITVGSVDHMELFASVDAVKSLLLALNL
jgi:hypothetical protein